MLKWKCHHLDKIFILIKFSSMAALSMLRLWWSQLSIFINDISISVYKLSVKTWWRHQMETFSALLAICAGISPVQRPVTLSFDVFFDLHPNKRLSKQWWGWWFEMPSCPLWPHRNELCRFAKPKICENCLGLVNSCVYYACQPHKIY